MAITAALVKELRDSTGAGMIDAKKALTEPHTNQIGTEPDRNQTGTENEQKTIQNKPNKKPNQKRIPTPTPNSKQDQSRTGTPKTENNHRPGSPERRRETPRCYRRVQSSPFSGTEFHSPPPATKRGQQCGQKRHPTESEQ